MRGATLAVDDLFVIEPPFVVTQFSAGNVTILSLHIHWVYVLVLRDCRFLMPRYRAFRMARADLSRQVNAAHREARSHRIL